MRGSFVVFAISLSLAVGHAHAHDLWLEKEDTGLGLYYGHKRSAHEGADFLEYNPEWVQQVLCFDGAGTEIAFEIQRAYPYRMRSGCAVAYVLVSSGYWTKTPYGTQNVPKNEARMPINSWLSYESVKRIDQWTMALAKPLTGGLEMTPVEDPLKLGKGQKLRLGVTFGGQPVKGVIVTYDGKARGQTGADGRINVRLRHGGFQVIQASFNRPDASGKADEVIHAANLNFELPEGR